MNENSRKLAINLHKNAENLLKMSHISRKLPIISQKCIKLTNIDYDG